MTTEELPPPPSPEQLLALRLVPRVGNALAQYALDRYQSQIGHVAELIDEAAREHGTPWTK